MYRYVCTVLLKYLIVRVATGCEMVREKFIKVREKSGNCILNKGTCYFEKKFQEMQRET